ncbi:Acg family FMN-binding oxidoreductase [Streptomyces sp. NPDC015220]|uniref:Acg family FMN-binding oxidoreductase n=1 Tax=Streptomyces sp. NPDC015220 TaxID=3364947 RepID=UPI003700878A
MRTPEVDAAAVESLLHAAVAAPSMHNTQPWRFGMAADTRAIHVRVDRARRLPLSDPGLRAQHLSVGAAVFNLRVAAAHLGWDPDVRLLPDPADPDLLATVRLGAATADARSSYGDLYDAVTRRHTSRMPFTGRPVPEHIVTEMAAAARAEGGHLDVPDVVGTRRLLRLTALAEARNAADPARTAEARRWITAADAPTPYGIPLTSLGARDLTGRMPMRDFTGPLRGPRPPVPSPPVLRFERHAQVALLWTPQDRPADWLRAGQALERALLVATRHGVRTSMLHQAMEWPDLRAAMGAPGRRCSPHLLIRFGYGPEGGRTPRASADAAAARRGTRNRRPAAPARPAEPT